MDYFITFFLRQKLKTVEWTRASPPRKHIGLVDFMNVHQCTDAILQYCAVYAKHTRLVGTIVQQPRTPLRQLSTDLEGNQVASQVELVQRC